MSARSPPWMTRIISTYYSVAAPPFFPNYFFAREFHPFSSLFFHSLLSFPSRNSDPGVTKQAHPPPPPPHYGTRDLFFFLSREEFNPFLPSSTRVERRPLCGIFSVRKGQFSALKIACCDLFPPINRSISGYCRVPV